MRRLLAYMKPYWRTVSISIVLLLLQSLLQIAGPLITKTAIDKYLLPASGAANPGEWLSSDA